MRPAMLQQKRKTTFFGTNMHCKISHAKGGSKDEFPWFGLNERFCWSQVLCVHETNIAPETDVWKTTFLLKLTLFRGHVSFHKCTCMELEFGTDHTSFFYRCKYFAWFGMGYVESHEHIPSRELTCPTLGKGKSFSKVIFDGIC